VRTLSNLATSVRTITAGVVIVATLGISAAAARLQWLAFEAVAAAVGWPPEVTWLLWPVVELFLFAGTAELACREWERRTADRRGPLTLVISALSVALLVSVAHHLIDAAAHGLDPKGDTAMWGLALVLALVVPFAQVGSLHLLYGRLRTLGQTRAAPAPAARRRIADQPKTETTDQPADRDIPATPSRTATASPVRDICRAAGMDPDNASHRRTVQRWLKAAGQGETMATQRLAGHGYGADGTPLTGPEQQEGAASR
jgi:hypothetical protein